MCAGHADRPHGAGRPGALPLGQGLSVTSGPSMRRHQPAARTICPRTDDPGDVRAGPGPVPGGQGAAVHLVAGVGVAADGDVAARAQREAAEKGADPARRLAGPVVQDGAHGTPGFLGDQGFPVPGGHDVAVIRRQAGDRGVQQDGADAVSGPAAHCEHLRLFRARRSCPSGWRLRRACREPCCGGSRSALVHSRMMPLMVPPRAASRTHQRRPVLRPGAGSRGRRCSRKGAARR